MVFWIFFGFSVNRYFRLVVEVFFIYLVCFINIWLLKVVVFYVLLNIGELFMSIVRWKSLVICGEESNVSLDVVLDF